MNTALDIQILFDYAVQFHEAGRLDDAERLYRRILDLDPHHADALHLLGTVAHQRGRSDLALSLIEEAIRITDNNAAYHFSRGRALRSLGQCDEALASYGIALRLRPDFPEAHNARGEILSGIGRFEEALACYNAALRLNPAYAEGHYNRGNALIATGRPLEALAAYDAALQIAPNHAGAYNNRGTALVNLARLDEALASYDAALGIRPDYLEALTNRGNALAEAGRVDEAVAAYEAALRMRPDHADAHNNLIYCLHLVGNADGRTIRAAAERFATFLETMPPAKGVARDPERRLRVGLVSGDFRKHPAGFFLRPFMINRMRSDLDIFCYATRPGGDELTEELRRSADHWRSLVGETDKAAAEQVRADAIDILVDLSGHTAHNRLPLFALRPAPVQATWLGYWGTTGLGAMDYILSDAVAIPPGDEIFFTEKVLRLPATRLCYLPPPYAPAPAPPPSGRGGAVTFGSFNNVGKMGPEVVALWANVLHAVPGARLLLKWWSLADESARRRVTRDFAAQGIGSDRLILRSASPHARMLAEYGDMDIALDPFPFSGGLTSCEALWMGVPVVTLPGRVASSRQTLGFLQTLGLTGLVAADKDEYIRIAANLAGNPDQLRQLRQGLRPQMAASALCDGRAYARDVEAAFRLMWRTWCAQHADAPVGP